MAHIKSLEQKMGGEKGYPLIDRTRENPTEEQVKYRELFGKLNQTQSAVSNYKAKSDLKTELTQPIENIRYVVQEVTTSKQYQTGLKQFLSKEILKQLLNEYLPLCQASYKRLNEEFERNVIPKARMLLLHQRDELIAIQKFFDKENAYKEL